MGESLQRYIVKSVESLQRERAGRSPQPNDAPSEPQRRDERREEKNLSLCAHRVSAVHLSGRESCKQCMIRRYWTALNAETRVEQFPLSPPLARLARGPRRSSGREAGGISLRPLRKPPRPLRLKKGASVTAMPHWVHRVPAISPSPIGPKKPVRNCFCAKVIQANPTKSDQRNTQSITRLDHGRRNPKNQPRSSWAPNGSNLIRLNPTSWKGGSF